MFTRDGIYAQPLIWNVWLAGLILAALSKTVEWFTLDDVPFSYDPWALSGPFLALLILESNRKLVLNVLFATVIIAYVIVIRFPNLHNFAIPYAMAIGSFFALIFMIIFRRTHDRAKALFMLMIGSLLPLWQQVSDALQNLSTIEDLTFDCRAYLVDLSLGFNPLALVASIESLPMPLLIKAIYSAIFGVAYISIMMMMALTVLLQLEKKSSQWLVAFTAMMVAGGLGGLLYHVFPAIGPKVFHGHVPITSKLTPGMYAFDPAYIRNCMPSLHMAWAFLILMNMKGLSRMFQLSAILFAILTFFATMILREHYLIDLIVALPYAVAAQIFMQDIIHRKWPHIGFWIGAGLVAFWFYALIAHVGWFLAVPGFTIAFSLLTIIASIFAYAIASKNTYKVYT